MGSLGVTRIRIGLVLALLGVAGGHAGIHGGDVLWSSPVVVVIDPGHGGSDPGAISRSGDLEKDLTLSVARLVALEASRDPGLRVVLTRENDRFVELADRAAKARQVGAALFVSLHANAYSDPSVSGIETFVDEAAPCGGRSEQLAALLQRNVLAVMGSKDRGVRRASLFLWRLSIPAALVEMGFMTHTAENRALHDVERQKGLARAILSAVRAFLGGEPTSQR
ncbi:MAG: N-acetylmuramoyl-L-alanine amidase [Candidatus Bipolaricaulota bacterium]